MKFRNEIKYLCSERELNIIEYRINQICSKDIHANSNGTYLVRSVYFDNYINSCCEENESGVNNREKYRIRIYDGKLTHIFFECKRKENEKSYKISFKISEVLCEKIMKGDILLSDIDSNLYETEEINIMRKFIVKCMVSNFTPVIIVEYERTPYIYETGNVRITFDRNITSCSDIKSFTDENILGRPIMPIGKHILEVKYDELLPDFLYNVMQVSGLKRTAYSKYLMCRKYKM